MSRFRLLLILGLAFVAFVGWFLYQLVGPAPSIRVSKQTTWLTEPLAADGLPDYATWLLDQQRAGVTPENNAAIPFLQAMWPIEISRDDQAIVCKELGMEVPTQEGLSDPGYDKQRDNSVQRQVVLRLLAAKDIKPDREIRSADEFEQWKSDWTMNNTGFELEEPAMEMGSEEAAADETASDAEFEEGFVDPVDPFTAADERATLLLDTCQETPWTAEQMPELAQWMDEHQREFDLLHEAAGRPKYYFPSPSLITDPNASFISILLPHIQSIRDAERMLSLRVMQRLGAGDVAGAWEAIEDMHRLADLVPGETLIGQLVAIACQGIADARAQQLLDLPELPVEVAQQMQTYYAARSPRRLMAQSIDSLERLMMVTTVLNLAGARVGKDGMLGAEDMGVEPQFALLQRLAIDWNLVLVEMNKWYDRISEAMRVEGYEARKVALDKLEAEMQATMPTPAALGSSIISRKARSLVAADVMAGLLLPAISAAINAEDRINADLALMQTAAALAVHRAREGGYPDTLDALVPDLLPQLPVDNFTGAALVYAKTDQGYLLVNCGPNGIDDGGSNEMYSCYKGYTLNDDDLDTIKAICKLLGEEVPEGDAQAEDPMADVTGTTLQQSIPSGSDDRAIRLPLLPAGLEELLK